MNTDDLFAQIDADEEQDRIDTQAVATPIDYGKLRKIYPQRVYAAIRQGKLQKTVCACGRSVIDVAEADILFKFNEEPENESDEEYQGGDSGRDSEDPEIEET